MEKYKCNDNTLMHGVLFNIPRLESIMKYGLVSLKYAKEHNIDYSKNYDGCNLDDSVSMVRFLYINYNDPESAYSKYITKGISFLVEDVAFTYNQEERNIHRTDEVLVSSNIAKSKITGIIIPEEYENIPLYKLNIISTKMNRYHNVKDTCDYIVNYLEENNHDFDIDYYKDVLGDLKYIAGEINKSLANEKLINFFARLKKYFKISELKNISNDISNVLNNKSENEILKKVIETDKEGAESYLEYNDLVLGFQDDISEINTFLAEELSIYYGSLLNKKNCTVKEITEYLNNKYLHLPIYNLPNDKIKVK